MKLGTSLTISPGSTITRVNILTFQSWTYIPIIYLKLLINIQNFCGYLIITFTTVKSILFLGFYWLNSILMFQTNWSFVINVAVILLTRRGCTLREIFSWIRVKKHFFPPAWCHRLKCTQGSKTRVMNQFALQGIQPDTEALWLFYFQENQTNK